ncbi:uncharacterized protein LOC129602190 [Paramacrobiotus metropolitanus]|uniref:uncharacterized protein LOC129602190 n=1 Tax=Paramacrobiotus metropolitanus TaxID=2943436 RepID=UPI0024465961|nr:uncharacterized protein LOC129602190 [Paramacrobiotus metropolitanus]
MILSTCHDASFKCSWWMYIGCSVLLQLQLCAACPTSPQRKPSGPDLTAMLAEALLYNRQDDRITLTQLPTPEVAGRIVSRPRLGENVTFRCEVPADTDPRSVSWLHQDRTIFEAGQPLPVTDGTGQAYDFSRVNRTLILVVSNVTMRSGGSLECIAAPPGSAYTPQRHVLQRFMLLPLITRRDEVFTPSDGYVTATEGDMVAVPFTIRLPLPEAIYINLREHFIWRLNGRVVQGPTEEPYGSLMPTSGLAVYPPRDPNSNQTAPPNSPGQLFTLPFNFWAVTLADEGTVECFFRPHRHIHEWIFQSTPLLVFSKTPP